MTVFRYGDTIVSIRSVKRIFVLIPVCRQLEASSVKRGELSGSTRPEGYVSVFCPIIIRINCGINRQCCTAFGEIYCVISVFFYC